METLGERFQKETKYDRRLELPEARVFSHPEQFKSYPDAPRVALPMPPEEKGPGLWETIMRRESVRSFSAAPISMDTLARLLWSIAGVRKEEWGCLFRTVPSAGGLYPIETYIMANRVEELEKGIYHLHVPSFSLELVNSKDHSPALTQAALGQKMVGTSAVTVIWTAVIDRCRIKYGERGFRYIYLDAGHAGQNLYLAATGLGLGCCTIGAFFDDEINEVLGVDGTEETVLYMGAVGNK